MASIKAVTVTGRKFNMAVDDVSVNPEIRCIIATTQYPSGGINRQWVFPLDTLDEFFVDGKLSELPFRASNLLPNSPA